MRRCPWPTGCEQWCGADEQLCYTHTKVLDGMLDIHDWCTRRPCSHRSVILPQNARRPDVPEPRTVLDSSVLSDEQLEIAHLLSALGATDIVVKGALERRRVRGAA